MATGDEPYGEPDDSEIEGLFQQSILPDTTGIGPLGPVILRCWTSDFHHMSEIARCIEDKS